MAQAVKSRSSSKNGSKLGTPMELFLHELSDIRSAETIIISMLEKAQKAATNEQLVAGLKAHLEQSRGHLENVDEIFKSLGESPEEMECKGAKGLYEEFQEAVKAKPASEVLDSMIGSGGIKTEHYEIVAYEGLVDQANALDLPDAVTLLMTNLTQEQETLKKLEKLEPKLQEAVNQLAPA